MLHVAIILILRLGAYAVPNSTSVLNVFERYGCLQVQAVHPLTRYRLQRLISTREEDLVGMHKMGSVAALEKYAEGTSSQLLYLQVSNLLSSAYMRISVDAQSNQ